MAKDEEGIDDGSAVRVDNGIDGGRRSTARIAPSQGFSTTSSSTSYIQPKPGATLSGKLWTIVFLAHLVAIEVIIAFLAIHGLAAGDRDFHPKHWCGPLFTSVALSIVVAIAWLVAMLRRPLRALKVSLWLAPLLTCATGVLLMDTDAGLGLAFASIAIVAAIVQSLYACWVTPRLTHSGEILAASLSTIGAFVKHIKLAAIALVVGLLFSTSWVLGVSGVAARPPHLAPLYIVALLLSLTWTTHVIRNTLHVAISRTAYLHLTARPEPTERVWTALARSLGTVVVASALSPLVVVVRGTARAMTTLAGGADEFLFSCSSCCMGLADGLVVCVNRWALVHVGAHGSGLGEASRRAWGAFERARMVGLADSDLTSSICFFAGVAGGAACSLVGGVWAIVVDKAYTTGVAVYAFLVGYFMVRIAMAWPQGCVSAYLVAYAEDPGNPFFGSAIPNRIRELQSP